MRVRTHATIARPCARKASPEDRARIVGAARKARKSKKAIVDAARRDPAMFAAYVLRDDQTGRPIAMAPMHEEWHDLLSRHPRAVIWSATDQGKTTQISVARALWEIGNNPEIRIGIVTEARSLGEKIIESIKTYITESAEVAEVFPHLRRGRLWTQSRISVARKSKSKDPTVQAVGFRGRILGSRLDLIVIDDFLSPENTYTEHQRTVHHRWLKSTIEGRKAPDARLWFIGNALHKRDSMHLYAREEGCVSRRFSVLDETGQPRWPARWSLKRYREECINRGPVEAARSLDCNAADDNTSWFPIKDIWPALAKGDGFELIAALRVLLPGWLTITAIDLGVKTHEAADDTAIITIAVDPKGVRRILWVESGKWRGSEIIKRAVAHHHRYHSTIWVETNGAQDYLRQNMSEEHRTIPIKAFITTGRNRMHPTFGIQSLAAGMASGAWIIPNHNGSKVEPDSDSLGAVRMHHEISKLMGQILAFSPDAHTGDLLQALWIADTGARAARRSRVETGKKPRRM